MRKQEDSMPIHSRITCLQIEKYRSISERVTINFPENTPVVLVGENNAGKSNIVRALELVLGEMWPGSRQPDDHDFWNRTPIMDQYVFRSI
jgi:putative ATP-dependent endonuclease of OLD family